MSAIMNTKEIKGIGLIIAAVLLLVLPGVLYNNLNASGLIVNQSLSCVNATAGIPTCQGAVPVGCQSVASQCNLQGGSISILNQQSPFTQLFSGNIFGFFNALTSSGVSGTKYNGDVSNPVFGQGPFDAFGGNTYVNGVCTIYPGSPGRTGFLNYNITGCTQTVPQQNTNVTSNAALNMTNYNPVQATATYNLALYQVYNNKFPTPDPVPPYQPSTIIALACDWIGTYNFTTTGSGSSATSTGYTWYGCNVGLNGWISPPPFPQWSFVVAIDNSIHQINNGYNHVAVFIQPQQWDSVHCLLYYSIPHTYPQFASQNCLTFENNVNPAVIGASSTKLGAFTSVLAFIGGIILFIIGLGINLSVGGSILGTGSSASVGVNTQGTRLAQVLGIGLIVWAPLYSEFSLWFTSGGLPNGIGPLITILLTALFFIGFFWTLMSWGGGGEG